MSDAREDRLGRVRAALADRPQPAAAVAAGGYRRAPADPVALFVERAGEYRATVHRVGQAGVAALVAEICAAHGARRLAVPPDLPEAWLPPGVEATGDATVAALDRVDGVLTGCAAAIAETGTIVLDGGPGSGHPRADAGARLAHLRRPGRARVCLGQRGDSSGWSRRCGERRAPLTLISGPSATSDIELSRVEGVHGPRRLEIVIAT